MDLYGWICMMSYILNIWISILVYNCVHGFDYGMIQRLDGWYNNLMHPSWGSANSKLLRLTPPAYEDGVYQMPGINRPNPQRVSRHIFEGSDGLRNERNLTALFAFFGQVVAYELMMTNQYSCPIEIYNIPVRMCENETNCKDMNMPFSRAEYDKTTGNSPNRPREQLNKVTSWIDGSFIYSTKLVWLQSLRGWKNGILQTSQGGKYPALNTKGVPTFNIYSPHKKTIIPPEQTFVLGDPRINENPPLLIFSILFLRWHNYIAENIQVQHPTWYDEDIFLATRRWVIATMQNIIMYEYVPTLLGEPMPPYKGYKPDLFPGVSHEFQSAAFRYGHTLVPSGMYLRDKKCNFTRFGPNKEYRAIRLCNTWWDAQGITANYSLDHIIMGMTSQMAERDDHILVSDLRDRVFGPIQFTRQDLIVLNIMRGRDNGIADYNTVRAGLKLPRIENWTHINPFLAEQDPKLFEMLEILYGDLDNIDMYVGGLLESHPNKGPGTLFNTIIRGQFERIRDSDRFWFENVDNGIFDPEEIAFIKSIKLYDIIVNVTDISSDDIQRNVFTWEKGDPCEQPMQLGTRMPSTATNLPQMDGLEMCDFVETYDFFSGNERTYVITCIILAISPVIAGLFAWFVVRKQSARRQKLLDLAKNKTQRTEDLFKKAMIKNLSPPKSLIKNSNKNGYINENGLKPETMGGGGKLLSFNQTYGADNEAFNVSDEETVFMTSIKDESNAINGSARMRTTAHSFSTMNDVKGQGGPRRLGNAKSKQYNYMPPNKNKPLREDTKLLQAEHEMTKPDGYHHRHPRYSAISMVSTSWTQNNTKSGKEMILAYEWLNEHHRRKIVLDLTNDDILIVLSRKGVELKRSQFTALGEKIQLYMNQNGPRSTDESYFVLIKAFEKYDLLLEFKSLDGRDLFACVKFVNFAHRMGTNVEISYLTIDDIFEEAETKEKKQKLMDYFFRKAFTQTFENNLDMKNKSTVILNPTSNGTHKKFDNHATTKHNSFAGIFCTLTSYMINIWSAITCSKGKTVGNNANIDDSKRNRKRNSGRNDQSYIMNAKLTKSEFADALGMNVKSMFVERMFAVIDKRHTGYLCFQDLLNMTYIFANGTTEEKLRIMFDMFDIQQKGELTRAEFFSLLKGFIDCDAQNERSLDACLSDAITCAGFKSSVITFKDFTQLMLLHERDWSNCGIHFKGAGKVFGSKVKGPRRDSFSMEGIVTNPEDLDRTKNQHVWAKYWFSFLTYVEENRQNIFYLILFFFIIAGLFADKMLKYCLLLEHTDLRRVMGAGICVTRASASIISFVYCIMLLPLCRHLITKLQETKVKNYIPFESALGFHKLCAYTGIVFTILHVGGHLVNFYHISTQSLEYLKCLFPEMFFRGNGMPPPFSFWAYKTVTGLTGVLLTFLTVIIYVFAHEKVRKHAYRYFWSTHKLYILFYGLNLLHGAARLTAEPAFQWYLLGPAILFTIDKIISLNRKHLEVAVCDVSLLPSDVTKLLMNRPYSFNYKSGQWVQISIPDINPGEYHAFTLTSCPHEDVLSVHIKALGRWTWKVRNLFDPNNVQGSNFPRVFIDGPYGDGNQNWPKYEIAVMFGGGIGVTPYASILKDLVNTYYSNQYHTVECQKVYFMWVCPSHKSYEWLVNLLQEIKETDVKDLIEIHVFITQYFDKYDLRTTMLYICDKYFRNVTNKSLLTGLQAYNHFGRPEFEKILRFIQKKHKKVRKIGVFSCGPTYLTRAIDSSCERINKTRQTPILISHFENFG